jgi:predicted cupin superfamily sugar epimerase
MSRSVVELINLYQLQVHPEGGYYKETYRSKEFIPHAALPKKFKDSRNYSTAIYFLLEQGDFSAFHRLQSDECWHFYSGGTLHIHIIHLNGELQTVCLGSNSMKGEIFQFVVPQDCWFACEPAKDTAFSFVGCTVSPGFDFADFEIAKPNELIQLYPKHPSLIKRLTR